MRHVTHSKPDGDKDRPDRLPVEIINTVTHRQITLIIVLSLTLVIGINTLISISGIVDRIDGGGRIIQEKWKLLRSSDQSVDWLVLGDSSADQGVIPDHFEVELGGSALNLATVGNVLAINDVWMLDEYISRHGAPNNVVIVHVYDMWRREVETSAFAKIPLTPGFWWSKDPSLSLNLSDAAELPAFRYLPLYQAKSLLKKLADEPSKLRTPPRMIQSNGFSPVIESQPDRVESDFGVHKNFYSKSQFEITEANTDALDILVELADEHDFNVYIANSPIYEGMKSDPGFEEYYSGVRRLLTDLDERSPNIHYVLCETP